MANRQTSFLEELGPAARGTLALLVGDRKAAGFFDFSLRGLVGSFIALLLAAGLTVLIVDLVAGHASRGPAWEFMLIEVIALAGQLGFAALALRQMRRLDGFVPFVTAYNWTSAYLLMASLVFGLVDTAGLFSLFVIGVAGIILMVNLARLIVTLSPMQIAIFIVAQFIGVLVALVVALMLFPIPMEALDGASAAAAASFIQ